MARLNEQDQDRSFRSSHKRTRQINYADIIDTELRRILQCSNQGDKPGFIQTVDDLSDFLKPHKDHDFEKDLLKINTWKNEKEKGIRKANISKQKMMINLSALQYEAKRKLWLSIMLLLSRTGFFPARFIEMNIDTDPAEEFRKEEEELEGHPKSYEDMQWKQLEKRGKEAGIKGQFSRKKLIKELKKRDAKKEVSIGVVEDE